jgi:hypothetical protein
MNLPMMPTVLSMPITIRAMVAATPLATHRRRHRADASPSQPSVPHNTPSTRNQGSFSSRSCRSDSRRSIEAKNGKSMCSMPARLRMRAVASTNACITQPTAVTQQSASSTNRDLRICYSGSVATGSTAPIKMIAAPTALISRHWLIETGVPNMPMVPPSA